MRRVIIIRKDLHLKPGKLAAMVGHCCEAYWTNLMKHSAIEDNEFEELYAELPWEPGKPAIYHSGKLCKEAEAAFNRGEKTFCHTKMFPRPTMTVKLEIPKDIWNSYVNDIFTKTICEAKNLNQLKGKIEPLVQELGLKEGVDWGYINDSCKTELTPENPDGTCTVGAWFKPLPDDEAHKISKKFKLYGAFDED